MRKYLLNLKQSRLIGLIKKLYVMPGSAISAAFIIISSLLVPLWVAAENITKQPVYKVQAAYIYNFAKFTRWPLEQDDDKNEAEADAANFYICILGRNTFGDAIEAMKDKPGGDANIVVKHINHIPQKNECQVLYITQSEIDRLPQLLQSVADQPVLTVSDIEGFAVKGGCIELITIGGKIAFSINLKSAQRAQLKFSARLLELAKVVIDK